MANFRAVEDITKASIEAAIPKAMVILPDNINERIKVASWGHEARWHDETAQLYDYDPVYPALICQGCTGRVDVSVT